ncbi:hypothetical protein Prudu_005609 [Prunus dulcis]|uniref:Uncharacterized protein n=1 Tax=Prunus dulcis TaxID=3755 RepID=A0A4Y1QY04_PRUDU|nr:hypothetical protein Prudu_005609 [Prunus dulcis]
MIVLWKNYVWLDPQEGYVGSLRGDSAEISAGSQFLVSGPGIGVMSGIPKDSPRVLGKFGAGPFRNPIEFCENSKNLRSVSINN